jgi:hypothetical protein
MKQAHCAHKVPPSSTRRRTGDFVPCQDHASPDNMTWSAGLRVDPSGAALSDPANTFPVLAVGFGILAGWRYARTRQWRGTAATWLLLALCFGGVALWLHLVRG